MVGGVVFFAATVSFWVLGNRLDFVLNDESYVEPVYALLPLVAMVAVTSIAALYSRAKIHLDWLALVAALVSFVGIGMVLVYVLTVTLGLLSFSVPEEIVLLGMLLATLGLVSLGLVTINIGGRVLPRWCGVALVTGSPPSAFLGPLWGGLVLGGAWALVGFASFRAGTRHNQQSLRVR
jgi:hypothetical protein